MCDECWANRSSKSKRSALQRGALSWGPEKRVVITGLFDFFDVSAKELATRATLRYGLPRKLAPVLETSGRWRRIKAEIVCSMTSKYAIALYELLQLANLGHSVSDQTVGNVLKRYGIAPAPQRKHTTRWRDFIRAHMEVLAGTDFFTVEVFSLKGLVTNYVLFFIQLETRHDFREAHP